MSIRWAEALALCKGYTYNRRPHKHTHTKQQQRCDIVAAIPNQRFKLPLQRLLSNSTIQRLQSAARLTNDTTSSEFAVATMTDLLPTLWNHLTQRTLPHTCSQLQAHIAHGFHKNNFVVMLLLSCGRRWQIVWRVLRAHLAAQLKTIQSSLKGLVGWKFSFIKKSVRKNSKYKC